MTAIILGFTLGGILPALVLRGYVNYHRERVLRRRLQNALAMVDLAWDAFERRLMEKLRRAAALKP